MIKFFDVIKYYKDEPHQKAALLWLTNQLNDADLQRIARLWNPNVDTVYSLDTYCKYYSGTKGQKLAMVELNNIVQPYSEGFLLRWRNKSSKGILHTIVEKLEEKNYAIFRNPGEINIVYVESKEFKPNIFNDWVYLFSFDGDNPKLVGKFRCTTTAGTHYTKNPLNSGGCAIIPFGQFTCHQVGYHGRGSTKHEALVQTGNTITVYRDKDRDYRRTRANSKALDSTQVGWFGINLHSAFDSKYVNRWSAGCLVVQKHSDHKRYMKIVKSDPRYQKNTRFVFTFTVLDEREF